MFNHGLPVPAFIMVDHFQTWPDTAEQQIAQEMQLQDSETSDDQGLVHWKLVDI